MNASEVGEWGGERKGGGSDMREVFLWEGGGGRQRSSRSMPATRVKRTRADPEQNQNENRTLRDCADGRGLRSICELELAPLHPEVTPPAALAQAF